jgi:hypothetical protein
MLERSVREVLLLISIVPAEYIRLLPRFKVMVPFCAAFSAYLDPGRAVRPRVTGSGPAPGLISTQLHVRPSCPDRLRVLPDTRVPRLLLRVLCSSPNRKVRDGFPRPRPGIAGGFRPVTNRAHQAGFDGFHGTVCSIM